MLPSSTLLLLFVAFSGMAMIRSATGQTSAKVVCDFTVPGPDSTTILVDICSKSCNRFGVHITACCGADNTCICCNTSPCPSPQSTCQEDHRGGGDSDDQVSCYEPTVDVRLNPCKL